MQKFFGYLLRFAFGLLMGWLLMAYLLGDLEYDTTDNGSNRSGLALYIDNKTGCHYLGTAHGGLTPRLDSKGEHLCTGQE